MRTSKYTEEEMIATVRRLEAGEDIAKMSVELSVSVSLLHKWRSKYAGLSFEALSELRSLRAQNDKLKRMYAELSLLHESYKISGESATKQTIEQLIKDREASIANINKRCMEEIGISNNTWYARKKSGDFSTSQILKLAKFLDLHHSEIHNACVNSAKAHFEDLSEED